VDVEGKNQIYIKKKKNEKSHLINLAAAAKAPSKATATPFRD